MSTMASNLGRGSVHVVDRSLSYLRTRVTGYCDLEVANELIAVVDRWRTGRSGVHVFHDVQHLEDYDVDARERITRWAREQVPFFEGVHVLVERRTVAWGVNIIGIVSGLKMTSYHDASAFEEAFARCRART